MQKPRKKRKGLFIVLVLVVIVIATLSVYAFTDLMIAYDDASYLSNDIVQARVAGESGAELVRLMLAQPPNSRLEVGGVFNNPQAFRGIPVAQSADGIGVCNFAVMAPNLGDNGSFGGIRYGLQNESALMNINALPVLEENYSGIAAAASLLGGDIADEEVTDETVPESIAIQMLLSLPGMTLEIANAIMDFLDEDDEIREPGGAETLEYELLPSPIKIKNGPLLSVEELLLVQGVTPTLLFGADSNRNGFLDADEQQRFNVTVDTPGALGWAAYLTVHGAEANKTRDGELRVNVNLDDLETLYEQLLILDNDLYASYIVAFRMSGQPSASVAAAAGGNTQQNQNNVTSGGVWGPGLLESFSVDLSAGGNVQLNQILDLVGSTVTLGEGANARVFESPFPDDPLAMTIYMPILMDNLSTQDIDTLPGRINLMECPAELLYGMGILEDEQIEEMLTARQSAGDNENFLFETWPLTEGYISIDQMRQLMPLVTSGGDVFRAQIIGYHEKSGASHRSEYIIDATTVNPKIISWRDLSHLGRGFDMSVLGINNLNESATGSGNAN